MHVHMPFDMHMHMHMCMCMCFMCVHVHTCVLSVCVVRGLRLRACGALAVGAHNRHTHCLELRA